MDGVFMGKMFKSLSLCLLFAAAVWLGALLADRRLLNEELIRLHVVANSDSQEDQAVKLLVRDAVLQSLEEGLSQVADVDEARAYLEENLDKLRDVANAVLEAAGVDDQAVVSLCREAFAARQYETFTLPAGVYQALRITIGEGQGHNWWCVAFPSLCLPATSQGFSDVAAGAGFSGALTGALTGEEGCELRFYLLDALGRLENKLFTASHS